MKIHQVEFDERFLSDFCRRHHIRRLALFGSILTDKFRPDSDVDVLVEFYPDANGGNELSEKIGGVDDGEEWGTAKVAD